MVDIPKHIANGSGGNLFSDIKSIFTILRTRKTMVFAYGFMFTFVAFTAFLAFSPVGRSSPWFNIFTSSSVSTTTATGSGFRSQVSSMYNSFFFPNSSSSKPISQTNPYINNTSHNHTTSADNQTSSNEPKLNHTVNVPSPLPSPSPPPPSPSPPPPQSSPPPPSPSPPPPPPPSPSPPPPPPSSPSPVDKNETTVERDPKQNRDSNSTASLSKQNNDTISTSSSSHSTESSSSSTNKAPPPLAPPPHHHHPKNDNSREVSEGLLKSLRNCNIFDGGWVIDDAYPLYPPGSCPHIDEPFNCFVNGRPDKDFEKLRWKPKDCEVPRLNGTHMLEVLRGKRLVYVGDSLNRNMWESLICTLRNSAKDKSKVFEASGRREFRTEGFYSFVFQDYNCSVEFFRSPFLVQEWEMPDMNGTKKETLRLDLVERSSSKYKDADILVFNTGHWWTHEKTAKGKGYYQVGNHVYGTLNVDDAFHKALLTWAKWVDVNVNPNKTLVSFRGYSASHFSGGQWNAGGSCDNETQPIKNEKYLSGYEPKMRILESVMNEMKTPVFYLNITRMTDYRKDAHPSIYRKQNLSPEERKSPLRYQDCSHWCLPGVPEIWNELLYAEILIRHDQQQKQHQAQQKTP